MLKKMARNVVLNFMEDSMIRTADYPDHPDDIVINKNENIIGLKPIKEIDVWNYYSGVKNEMLKELKGRNLFIAIKTKGILRPGQKPVYIRHPYRGEGEYIRINNSKDFEVYHSGRTVEYHVTMPQMAPYYVIDFDAPGPFPQTKKITADIADALDDLNQVKKVEIRYTGKRGFHVLGWLKKDQDVDDSRNFLKKWLKEVFGNRKDVTLGESPKGSVGALGLSPMKVNGGQVALWSLRISGLCCVEVPRSSLLSFEKEDASLEKTYKKITGNNFVYGRDRRAHVINSFINEPSFAIPKVF